MKQVQRSYDTPGFAEFYEHLLHSLPPEYEPGRDLDVYWPLLEQTLQGAAGVADVCTGVAAGVAVLDLCTGSGRVLLGLLQRLASSAAAQAASAGGLQLRLAGVDSSEEMLAAARGQLAAARAPPPPWCRVEWHRADVAALGAPQLAALQLAGACRLVLISAGSFHHLLSAADQLACLRGVAAALSPAGPSWAVLNIFDPGHLQASPGEAAVLGPFRRTCVRQEAEAQPDGGRVWRQRFQLERYASPAAAAAGDAQQLSWRRQEEWALREVAPHQLRQLAAQAGLAVVRQQARWGDTCGAGAAPPCADADARIFVLGLQPRSQQPQVTP